MAEYVQAPAQNAALHEAKAADLIDAGERADVSDHYVLFTVVFATVLFLAAVAERFKWRMARVGDLAIATALLMFGLFGLLQLPVT